MAALEQWPESGIPDNPGAWLMATAKHRAIDRFRRNTRLERKLDEFGRELASKEMAVPDLAECAGRRGRRRPVAAGVHLLSSGALHERPRSRSRCACLGGLSTGEIARAFLVPERTIAQRIVRAKRTLSEARVPFEVPRGSELAARLSSVLEVIYLIFNEGYSATSGDDWLRPALCEDALRLGRILAECAPQEPEVHGLVALMEIQASRSRARVGPAGEPILLLDQNRAQWDQLLIRRGLAALERAERLGTVPWPVRNPGRHRRLSCASGHAGRYGVAADCRALRCPGAAHPLSDCGTESCGRGGDGVRPASGAGVGGLRSPLNPR